MKMQAIGLRYQHRHRCVAQADSLLFIACGESF